MASSFLSQKTKKGVTKMEKSIVKLQIPKTTLPGLDELFDRAFEELQNDMELKMLVEQLVNHIKVNYGKYVKEFMQIVLRAVEKELPPEYTELLRERWAQIESTF